MLPTFKPLLLDLFWIECFLGNIGSLRSAIARFDVSDQYRGAAVSGRVGRGTTIRKYRLPSIYPVNGNTGRYGRTRKLTPERRGESAGFE